MKIKHSKFKNTGLIFELLVKQVAADTLSKRDSPAVQILKKFYTGSNALTREFKLYEILLKNRGVSQNKAESTITSLTEVFRKIDQRSLRRLKYELIAEVKKYYDLDEFFSIQVRDYKPLAALYCLLESQHSTDRVDPTSIITNRLTLLEYLTFSRSTQEDNKDELFEEYAKYDKDLRLLTFKILLEKFNDQYKNFLPEQKSILREFITSVDSTAKLKNLFNGEIDKVSKELLELGNRLEDGIVRIKLDEVLKTIKPLDNKQKVVDSHLVQLMQYYDLIHELKTI